MPVGRFWFMNSQVERIYAEESLRLLPIAQTAMGDSKEVRNSLTEILGQTQDVRPLEFIETSEESKDKLKLLSGR